MRHKHILLLYKCATHNRNKKPHFLISAGSGNNGNSLASANFISPICAILLSYWGILNYKTLRNSSAASGRSWSCSKRFSVRTYATTYSICPAVYPSSSRTTELRSNAFAYERFCARPLSRPRSPRAEHSNMVSAFPEKAGASTRASVPAPVKPNSGQPNRVRKCVISLIRCE